jgi:hypothetical protein
MPLVELLPNPKVQLQRTLGKYREASRAQQHSLPATVCVISRQRRGGAYTIVGLKQLLTVLPLYLVLGGGQKFIFVSSGWSSEVHRSYL